MKNKGRTKGIKNLKPCKPGETHNPKGRPKGRRDFKTDFEEAAREIAKALRLGDKPDPIYIKLMQAGIKSGLKGNYNFWRDIAERIYGKEIDKIDITSKGKALTNKEADEELAKLVEKHGQNILTKKSD